MAVAIFFRYILERYYDVQVAAMFVVCVHPDVGDSAFVDEVPDLTHEVSLIMAEQRRRHADVGRLVAQREPLRFRLQQIVACRFVRVFAARTGMYSHGNGRFR